jgi:HEAT repeat protein
MHYECNHEVLTIMSSICLVLLVLPAVSCGEKPMDRAIIAQLFAQLKSDNDDLRSQAADHLVELAQQEDTVIPKLISALRDRNHGVRYKAASVLGRIGGPRATVAIPELARLFADDREEEPIRNMAANALGLLGPESVPALARQLQRRTDVFGRRKAADALSRNQLSAREAIPVLINCLSDDDSEVRLVAVESLARFGEAAVQPLLAALKRDNPYIQVFAAEALLEADPRRGPSVIQVLSRGLQHSSRAIRVQAASALTRVGPEGKRVIPLLVLALKDEDDDVRYNAADALGSIGPDDKSAIPALINSLADPHPYVRGYAAVALGKCGPRAKAAVSALVKLIHDENEEVRTFAARSLGQIGPEAGDAIPALKSAIKDPLYQDDFIFLEAVKQALGRLGPR